MRGQPAGKVVESIRAGANVTWPHMRGHRNSQGGSAPQSPMSDASPRGEFATSGLTDDMSMRLPVSDMGSLQLTRMSLGKSATDVTALPAQDVWASRDVMALEGIVPALEESDRQRPAVISVAQANCLADVAAAAAECEALRIYPDELPPSPEPLYVDNPWRLGITARSKERGANRMFPCFMLMPHAKGGAAAGSMQSKRIGGAPLIGNTISSPVLPPEPIAADTPYRCILPSTSASASSTNGDVVLSDNGEEVAGGSSPRVASLQQKLAWSDDSFIALAQNVATVDKKVVVQDGPNEAARPKMLRSPRAASGGLPTASVIGAAAKGRGASSATAKASSATAKASSRTLRPQQQKQQADKKVPERKVSEKSEKKAIAKNAPAPGPRNTEISASARLAELRAEMAKNLKSAEDGLYDDLKPLTGRLTGKLQPTTA